MRDRESETPGKGDAGAIQYGSGQYLARAASMCCCTRPDGVDLLRRFDAVAFAGQAHVHEDHRGSSRRASATASSALRAIPQTS